LGDFAASIAGKDTSKGKGTENKRGKSAHKKKIERHLERHLKFLFCVNPNKNKIELAQIQGFNVFISC
jgi:hypothetical protein